MRDDARLCYFNENMQIFDFHKKTFNLLIKKKE